MSREEDGDGKEKKKYSKRMEIYCNNGVTDSVSLWRFSLRSYLFAPFHAVSAQFEMKSHSVCVCVKSVADNSVEANRMNGEKGGRRGMEHGHGIKWCTHCNECNKRVWP